jgi:hypothetical protein
MTVRLPGKMVGDDDKEAFIPTMRIFVRNSAIYFSDSGGM